MRHVLRNRYECKNRLSFRLIASALFLSLATFASSARPEAGTDSEIQKVKASEGLPNEEYGFAVTIDGLRAMVGAQRHGGNGPGAGAAYSLSYDGESWIEDQILIGSDTETGDRFGISVSVRGDVAVVGAPFDNDMGFDSGSAYVFRHNGTRWIEEQKLVSFDGELFDFFGMSVATDGNVAWIGAPGDNTPDNDAGSVYVYRYNGSSWAFEQRINASDAAAFDFFGQEISATGDVLLVGALEDDDAGGRSGSAYVYRFDGAAWIEEQKLTASDGKLNAQFGSSVAIEGNLALIGAFGDDRAGDRAVGAAYVFRHDGSTWNEEQKLVASDGMQNDALGFAVALSNGLAVVSARDDDLGIGSKTGSAYVFRRVGSRWIEERKLAASDPNTDDRFGSDVSMSGDTCLIGALADGGSGSTYVFTLPDCRAGTVDAGAARAEPVLRVNASYGGTKGIVGLATRSPLTVDMQNSASGPDKALFVLYAWIAAPDGTTNSPQPLDLGTMCFPTFLTVGLPKPQVIWNNVGHANRLGPATFPSTPAPSTVFSTSNGARNPITFTLQGFLEDSGSAAPVPWSVTNAVVVVIQ